MRGLESGEITDSGSRTFSLEAKGRYFLCLVKGDMSACARHISGTRPVIKLQSSKNMPSCFFGVSFGAVRFCGFLWMRIIRIPCLEGWFRSIWSKLFPDYELVSPLEAYSEVMIRKSNISGLNFQHHGSSLTRHLDHLFRGSGWHSIFSGNTFLLIKMGMFIIW